MEETKILKLELLAELIAVTVAKVAGMLASAAGRAGEGRLERLRPYARHAGHGRLQ